LNLKCMMGFSDGMDSNHALAKHPTSPTTSVTYAQVTMLLNLKCMMGGALGEATYYAVSLHSLWLPKYRFSISLPLGNVS